MEDRFDVDDDDEEEVDADEDGIFLSRAGLGLEAGSADMDWIQEPCPSPAATAPLGSSIKNTAWSLTMPSPAQRLSNPISRSVVHPTPRSCGSALMALMATSSPCSEVPRITTP